MLPIFTVGTSVVSFTFEMVVNDLPKVLCLNKSDSELRTPLTTKGLVCELLERVTLLTQKSGGVNHSLLFLLPPKMERFWDGNVLKIFSSSLPAMLDRWLFLNTRVYDILAMV